MRKRMVRRASDAATLNMTSMMDMMTIILVFLLKSYGTDAVAVMPSDELQIPVSSSQRPPRLAVTVLMSQSAILVDGEPVLALETTVDPNTGQEVVRIPDTEMSGPIVAKLHEVLVAKATKAKEIGARSEKEEFAFKGELLLQCDRRLPFSVIRDVLFTAGQAEFGNFRFVVTKQGE